MPGGMTKGFERNRADFCHNLLRRLDAGALAAALAPWLATLEGTLPLALAVDGK